jgi:hypothetical protein
MPDDRRRHEMSRHLFALFAARQQQPSGYLAAKPKGRDREGAAGDPTAKPRAESGDADEAIRDNDGQREGDAHQRPSGPTSHDFSPEGLAGRTSPEAKIVVNCYLSQRRTRDV